MPSTDCRAVVLTGPYQVTVKTVAHPSIQTADDAVIQVLYSGLCGSDLHNYRGNEGPQLDYVLGHEAVGRIVEVGSAVKNFSHGDMVLAPFSLHCGQCFFCQKHYTARCSSSILLGTPEHPGAQAEYLRIPLASTSLVHLDPEIPPTLALLLCDILPTGLSVAANAHRLLDEGESMPTGLQDRVCLVIGCGPVGLCAITAAKAFFQTVIATDLSPARLMAAEKHGAKAVLLSNVSATVAECTAGRGVDAALEVVGNSSALKVAMDNVRVYGVVSSCGVHSADIMLPGQLLYKKNLRMQFGRCSVKTFYDGALALLKQNLGLFGAFIERKATLEAAPECYALFEAGKIGKTVFVMEN